MRVLRRMGRRVPEDVAVGGFDDSHLAALTEPGLTTVRQPWRRISAELARLLVDLIAGGEPAGVLLPPELVLRGSTWVRRTHGGARPRCVDCRSRFTVAA